MILVILKHAVKNDWGEKKKKGSRNIKKYKEIDQRNKNCWLLQIVEYPISKSKEITIVNGKILTR